MFEMPGFSPFLGQENSSSPEASGTLEELQAQLRTAEEDLNEKLRSPGGSADSFQWDKEREEIARLKAAIEKR